MLNTENTPLERVAKVMYDHGAVHVFFKLLANNDNSKNQIYFGGDFDVLRIIPHGELIGEKGSDNKPIFKANLNFSWLPTSLMGPLARAPGAQLIFYPNYPEVRMSGFLRDCHNSPSKLMQAPTPEERASRENTPRCMVLGICPDDRILAFVGAWDSDFALDAIDRIERNTAHRIASVFFELQKPKLNSRDELLSILHKIYLKGPILSRRLNSEGILIPYLAANGAGYTLESFFGIIPNGRSEPDFKGWELKASSNGPVTLMTPEPDIGTYRDDLSDFLIKYGRCEKLRRDFTGRHQAGITCKKTSLTLRMEGFDPVLCEITDPNAGLILRDEKDNIVAGWTFNKIIKHWSKKHAQTAYVTYKRNCYKESILYKYGPEIILCQGADLKKLLESLYTGKIYYDPGINQKFIDDKWKSKKRNQLRISWNNVENLYDRVESIWF